VGSTAYLWSLQKLNLGHLPPVDVGQMVLRTERAEFEVRDVESLWEHYARTLRAWVGNQEAGWAAAVAEVGVQGARVWPPLHGGMPASRSAWV
jgi:cyclopropane fatty-acyl-phospholipid synthase-like methyltransferase